MKLKKNKKRYGYNKKKRKYNEKRKRKKNSSPVDVTLSEKNITF